jgi:hypothetical protein
VSIQSQLDAAPAGATVIVPIGTHNEAVYISKPVTLKAAGPGVIIKAPSGAHNAVTIAAHNVTVDGFMIVGANGDGIEGNDVHHAKVLNCEISGCGESGIQFNRSEFLTIEGNKCTGCALTGWFSGISVYQCRKIGGAGDLGDGYKTIIRNNVCDDNVTPASGWSHTDGNGIIIDDMNGTQTAGPDEWGGKTVVKNNLCRRNGGKGIQVTWSNNVRVEGNTSQDNGADTNYTETWRGELSASESKLVEFINNISVAKDYVPSRRSYAFLNTSQATRFNSTTYHGNIGWHPGGTPSALLDGGNAAPGAGVQWVDPKLNAAGVPTIATDAGYRPAGTLPPIEEPDPDMLELIARIGAIEASIDGIRTVTAGLMVSTAEAKVALTALEARVAGIEMLPIDPELGARVAKLEAFDQSVKDLD